MPISKKSEDYEKNEEIVPINFGFVNSFIIKGLNQIILVDTGIPGSTKKIIEKIVEEGFKSEQVSLIILTHAHFDHTGMPVN